MNRPLFKITFALLLTVASCMVGHAQTQQLVVWHQDGQQSRFALKESPKTTFTETDIVITTSTLSISYPISRVLRYTFETEASGIEDIHEDHTVFVSQKDDALLFSHLKSGTIIYILSADGKLLGSQPVGSQPTVSVSLSSYPAGVYIVKANDVTYKMLKR